MAVSKITLLIWSIYIRKKKRQVVYSGYGDVEVIASNLGISLYFIKNRLQLKLDLLRAVWELMPLDA